MNEQPIYMGLHQLIVFFVGYRVQVSMSNLVLLDLYGLALADCVSYRIQVSMSNLFLLDLYGLASADCVTFWVQVSMRNLYILYLYGLAISSWSLEQNKRK